MSTQNGTGSAGPNSWLKASRPSLDRRREDRFGPPIFSVAPVYSSRMTSSPTDQTLQLAVQHHQAGRLAEADRLYRQVLAREPANTDAWHLLGMIALQVGQVDAALELYRKAIALSPETAVFYD